MWLRVPKEPSHSPPCRSFHHWCSVAKGCLANQHLMQTARSFYLSLQLSLQRRAQHPSSTKGILARLEPQLQLSATMHGQGRSDIYHLGPEQITLIASNPGTKVSEQAKLDCVDNYTNIYHFFTGFIKGTLKPRQCCLKYS